MRVSEFAGWVMVGVTCLAVTLQIGEAKAQTAGVAETKQTAADAPQLDNATCLGCHGNQGFEMPRADGKMRSLYVAPDKFEHSVHGKLLPCTTCHTNITEIPHKNISASQAAFRRSIPDMCGMCHSKQRDDYLTSVHGTELIQKGNSIAATCADCHTPHAIARPAVDATRLAIIKNCGSCHKENLRSYMDTYHGQVTTLGYAYTAKCFDCHASHTIQRVKDPQSTVHPDNRLHTCQKCHANATAGFVTFQPHANTHNFERYPYMWIVSKFMLVLILGVFAFFWTHSALWFYREYKDRKEGKSRPHVLAGALAQTQGKYYQRFKPVWRLAHLVFALCLMTLSLTGMAVFYPDAAWAGYIMKTLGGPQVAAVIHRTAAVIILSIFLAQLIYFIARIGPKWKTFDWFGPNSLVPSLQDLRDIVAMFKWFFGKGPRPLFGRWNYLERFDYWAPFWGLTIVGGSGLMLWFKELTAAVWPGWMFNVATLAHGEEAFLAIVFLFTVHFFNNHFRPDKLPPPDIVMFTGAVSLEEFSREHTLEYNHLVTTGQLEKHLVNVPSPAMTLASKILGIALLILGLTILTLVVIGFVGTLKSGG